MLFRSFLFMKIAVPAMGPAVMIGGRIVTAAIALTVIARFMRKALPRGREWTPDAIVGVFYVALPLLMWGYASQRLSVSLLSIINAAAPLFAAGLSITFQREKMRGTGLAGLALGFAGVALLVGAANADAHPMPESRVFIDTEANGLRLTLQLPLNRLELAFGQPLSAAPTASAAQHREALAAYLLQHVGARGDDNQGWTVMRPSLRVTSSTVASAAQAMVRARRR